MNRRHVYFISTTVMLLLTIFVVLPVLKNMYEYRERAFYFLCASSLISLALSVIIFIEGRHYKNMQVIAFWIVITRIVDIIRFSMFPHHFFAGDIISMFGGILIFAHALGLIRDVIIRSKAGVYLVIAGFFTFIRFPIFIDFILYYNLKFSFHFTAFEGYNIAFMTFFYLVLLFQYLALDGIIKENKETHKYI